MHNIDKSRNLYRTIKGNDNVQRKEKSTYYIYTETGVYDFTQQAHNYSNSKVYNAELYNAMDEIYGSLSMGI